MSDNTGRGFGFSGGILATGCTENPKNKPSARPRPSRAGTHGVDALSHPEQLARKRERDRNVQREVRERTRKRIANLKTRIKELSTDYDPDSDPALKDALQRNRELEQELSRLKKALGYGDGTSTPWPESFQPLLLDTNNESDMAVFMRTEIPPLDNSTCTESNFPLDLQGTAQPADLQSFLPDTMHMWENSWWIQGSFHEQQSQQQSSFQQSPFHQSPFHQSSF